LLFGILDILGQLCSLLKLGEITMSTKDAVDTVIVTHNRNGSCHAKVTDLHRFEAQIEFESRVASCFSLEFAVANWLNKLRGRESAKRSWTVIAVGTSYAVLKNFVSQCANDPDYVGYHIYGPGVD
jgi:hypothetical protein